MKKLIAILFSLLSTAASATTIDLCFTPGMPCTQKIVSNIAAAKKTIYVQAFIFSSKPIAQALIDAHTKGLEVNVILDKTQTLDNKESCAKMLLDNHIPLWTDYKVETAHNKVIIIDGEKVITGSFNFTYNAQYKNAENVIIVDDKRIADLYFTNFESRKVVSSVLTGVVG